MSEIVWEGAELLREHLVPIDHLSDHEQNVRKGDVLALAASLRRFGQVRPILFDSDTIVAGHHLRRAARDELGWTHIAAFPHTFKDEDERLAYLVADNYLADLAGYDEQAQLTLLDEMVSRGNLEGTGITVDAVEDMRAAFGAVPEMPAQDWQGGYSEDPETAAARASALAQSQRMREVVLMLTEQEHEDFGQNLRTLQAFWGSEGGTKQTMLRAVAEAALATVGAEVPA